MKKVLILLLLASRFCVLHGQILLDSTSVDTVTLVSGLSTVWEVVYAPDGWVWYTEREGRIGRVHPVTKQNMVLTEIDDVYENPADGEEGGLLGMTLPPEFPDTPYVYVVYTYLDGLIIKEKLVRFSYLPDTLINPAVLVDHIMGNAVHNGSRLLINEGKIFMITGDAANPQNAQDLSALEGKVLRMNPDGSVPGDNPFPNNYIWAWGLRNSQGLTPGPAGKIFFSEHGPQSDDELNIMEKGRNYGWPHVKGYCDDSAEISFCIDSNVREPIYTWTPTVAPAGIEYYPYTYIPEFRDAVLFCTLKEQDLRALRLNSAGDSVISEKIYFDNLFGRIRDVCVSPTGEIFIGTSNLDGRAQTPFPLPGDDRIILVRNPVSAIERISNGSKVKVYPNPSCNLINIEAGNLKEPFSFRLYNAMGIIIMEEMVSGSFTISDINTGIYFFQVESANQTEKGKIIISP